MFPSGHRIACPHTIETTGNGKGIKEAYRLSSHFCVLRVLYFYNLNFRGVFFYNI
jgi:hypothetical protein